MPQTFKLSPSDLTFLWDECPRCFYLKVVRGFKRPAGAFPKIFGTIDRIMKEYFQGRSTAEFTPLLPAGRVLMGQRWVTSDPFELPGRRVRSYLSGLFDSLVEFESRTDGYAVIDFKTSAINPAHVPFYSRQLQAYAYCLEHPAPGKLSLRPVTRLGLFVVEPYQMERHSSDNIAYLGRVEWQEVPLDESQFLGFMDGVLALLEQPEPPLPAEKCEWCKYRQSARDLGV